MKLLDLLPWYVKYAVVAIVMIAYAPSWVAEKYDQRWDLRAAPHIKERDAQFKALEKDLEDIKQDTREIRNHLMGAK